MNAICIGPAQMCAFLFTIIPAGDPAAWYIDATHEVPQVAHTFKDQDPTGEITEFFCHGDLLSCLDAKAVAAQFPDRRLRINVQNLVRISSRGNWIRFADTKVTVKDRSSDASKIRCDARALKTQMIEESGRTQKSATHPLVMSHEDGAISRVGPDADVTEVVLPEIHPIQQPVQPSAATEEIDVVDDDRKTPEEKVSDEKTPPEGTSLSGENNPFKSVEGLSVSSSEGPPVEEPAKETSTPAEGPRLTITHALNHEIIRGSSFFYAIFTDPEQLKRMMMEFGKSFRCLKRTPRERFHLTILHVFNFSA